MSDTREDIKYYQTKFEPLRKSLSERLGSVRNFSRFYGSIFTKRTALYDVHNYHNATLKPESTQSCLRIHLNEIDSPPFLFVCEWFGAL